MGKSYKKIVLKNMAQKIGLVAQHSDSISDITHRAHNVVATFNQRWR